MTPEVLEAIATVRTVAGLPEISFLGITEPLDRFRARNATMIGANVPYWAVAWPGGTGLARFLLDRPEFVRGRHVVDLGCGAGLVAIAALKAGARSAEGVDIDPNALAAAAQNACLNGVSLPVRLAGFDDVHPARGDLICAGDLWYEPHVGRQATGALCRMAAAGADVLIGDPGRPSRPRRGTTELARCTLAASTEFEREETVAVRILSLAPILPAHGPHAEGEGDLPAV